MKHSSKSVDHYTPPAIARNAHILMIDREASGIDLDPSSCPIANKLVGASNIFTAKDDGLSRRWQARTVFLNPPGGRIGNSAAAAVWWEKLLQHWQDGDIDEAFFLGFNSSIIHISQSVLDFPVCIPSSRIKFWLHSEDKNWKLKPELRKAYVAERLKDGRAIALDDGIYLVESSSPQYNNVLVYLPPRSNLGRWNYKAELFKQLFGFMGRVIIPGPPSHSSASPVEVNSERAA